MRRQMCRTRSLWRSCSARKDSPRPGSRSRWQAATSAWSGSSVCSMGWAAQTESAAWQRELSPLQLPVRLASRGWHHGSNGNRRTTAPKRCGMRAGAGHSRGVVLDARHDARTRMEARASSGARRGGGLASGAAALFPRPAARAPEARPGAAHAPPGGPDLGPESRAPRAHRPAPRATGGRALRLGDPGLPAGPARVPRRPPAPLPRGARTPRALPRAPRRARLGGRRLPGPRLVLGARHARGGRARVRCAARAGPRGGEPRAQRALRRAVPVRGRRGRRARPRTDRARRDRARGLRAPLVRALDRRAARVRPLARGPARAADALRPARLAPESRRADAGRARRGLPGAPRGRAGRDDPEPAMNGSARPRVWVLNLDAEHELEAGPGYAPTRHLRAIVARESRRLIGSLVEPGDVVLGEGELGPAQREELRGLEGLAWSPTPRALARLAAAGASVAPAPPATVLRRVNARPFAAEVRAPLTGASFAKHVVATLDEALARLALPVADGWLVRRTFGAAGRGRRRIAAGRPAEAELAWLVASLRRGALVIEPWVRVTREYTRSGLVTPRGEVVISPPCFQETTPEGAWTRTERAERGSVAREDDVRLSEAVESAGRALA